MPDSSNVQAVQNVCNGAERLNETNQAGDWFRRSERVLYQKEPKIARRRRASPLGLAVDQVCFDKDGARY